MKDFTVFKAIPALAFLLFSLSAFSQAPASCTAAIGSPANGAQHHIAITWTAVGGSTSYDLEYSTDGSSWVSLSSGSTAITYDHNTGNIGNKPYYYQVRAVMGSTPTAWKSCTQYPIYSACDNPALPQLSNASSFYMSLTLVPETPDANPAITTYSIFCSTKAQFVQANGSLGSAEVFQTMAAWGTVIVSVLTPSTNYCFYVKAKNYDGDVRVLSGSTIMAIEPFTTSANFATGSATTSKFWSPASCTSGGLAYNAALGCSGGAIVKAGTFTNFFGCFLRTPQQNCTGNSSVVINFNLSNSYIASHIKASPSASDGVRFYMWVDGGYKNASSVKINGVEKSVTDINGTHLLFDVARACENVSVTFDLTTSTNLSNILFYIEPNDPFNDSNTFSVALDNVSILQNAPTACLTTTACVPVIINTNPSDKSVCENSSTSFSVIAGGTIVTYQWQESTNGGSTYGNLSNTGDYSGVNTTSLSISSVSTSMNGYKYRCEVTAACSGNPVSTVATLTVNTLPSVVFDFTGNPLCMGNQVTLSGTPSGGTFSGTDVSGGKFGASTVGSFVLTYNYTDGNSCENSDTANFVVVTCTGVNSVEANGNMNIYPNPFNENFTLDFNGEKTNGVARLYDMMGREVMQATLTGNASAVIHVPGLAEGVYSLMVITDEGKAITRKVVKIN